MIDLGLTKGVKSLWQEALLQDYMIKVEDKEFRVHKVVLAAVSDYFRAMFTRGMVESNKAVVELQDISPDTMSKLITLIYTGDEAIVNTDAREILALAVYFQMPTVIEVCTQKLLDNLCIENFMELLIAFEGYALNDAVQSIHMYLKSNLIGVIEHYSKDVIPVGVVQIILDLWEEAEWDACVLVKDWVSADFDNRRQHLNDLMGQVRFCLMPQNKLKAVMEMDVYAEAVGEGSWQTLVRKAVAYHKLPIHLKVLHGSEQSKVRSDVSPMFFTSGRIEHPATFFALDKENKWQKYEKKARYTPDFTQNPWNHSVAVAVNNFLVACIRPEENDWYIFNPRTLAWSRIACMTRAKISISLSHHGQYVYCVGGHHENYFGGQSTPSYKTEQYSLRTNTWTSIDAPTKFVYPGICVVGDLMYVSNSEEMWSLDCVSLQWQRKASPLGWPQRHTMHLLRFHNEDGLVILHPFGAVHFYSLALDQWSLAEFKFQLAFDYIQHGNECMEMTSGNSIYRINVHGSKSSPSRVLPPDAPNNKSAVCLIWKFSKDGNEAVEEVIDDFPIPHRPFSEGLVDPFGAMLAIPKDK